MFESEDDEDEVEARFDRSASPTSYIAYHARKQLAFDMWWLVLAVWISESSFEHLRALLRQIGAVCIIEKIGRAHV